MCKCFFMKSGLVYDTPTTSSYAISLTDKSVADNFLLPF